MQGAQKWTRPRHKRAEDDPYDENPVQEKSEGCEKGEEATYDCTGTHLRDSMGLLPSPQPRCRAPCYRGHLRLSVFTVRTRNLICGLPLGSAFPPRLSLSRGSAFASGLPVIITSWLTCSASFTPAGVSFHVLPSLSRTKYSPPSWFRQPVTAI